MPCEEAAEATCETNAARINAIFFDIHLVSQLFYDSKDLPEIKLDPRYSFSDMLKIPDKIFAAYLFDCDGTIADSMPLHYKAWLKALSRWSGEFPLPLFYAWAGRPTKMIVALLNEKYGLSMPPDIIDREREEAYLESLHLIEPIDDILAHVNFGHGRIPMAVVSGSPRDSVIKTLNYLGILDRFELIVGAEDYSHGKPHPEPFLKAAAGLGVNPAECLVFEDADLGVESAIAAGMSWVKLPPPVF